MKLRTQKIQFDMKPDLIFLVLLMLMCIIKTKASDVLHCAGEKQSDGQIHLTMTHDLKRVAHDCETQLLVDGKVTAYFNAEENQCLQPIANITANSAILQICPTGLECHLVCFSLGIHEKKPCFCNSTAKTHPEGGSSIWNTGVVIGACVCGLLVIIMITSVACYMKNRGPGYTTCDAEV